MATIILVLALLQSVQDVYQSANADFDAGRWAEAAAKYEAVLKEDPRNFYSRFNLAVCFTRTGKTVAVRVLSLVRVLLRQETPCLRNNRCCQSSLL